MANVDFGAHYKKFVRYFWDPEPKNDDPAMNPIWCLGRQYSADADRTQINTSNKAVGKRQEADVAEVATQNRQNAVRMDEGADDDPTKSRKIDAIADEDGRSWPADFLDDFEARFWFSYRSHFASIKKSTDPIAGSSLTLAVRLRSQLVEQGGFTSDTGWGCMIRSGQCLVANALAMLQLGRDWRRGMKLKEECQIISLFADDPRAPFSIHRFVEHGALACGKHPGEWFGPSATSRCIQALSQNDQTFDLKVYVNGDGPDVYEDTLLRLARGGDGKFHPVLVLVGIRLGIDRVTPVYWEALKRSLQLPQSVGIAGGRPSSSHYFVGIQGDNFFYLDPHHTRQMVPYYTHMDDYSEEDVSSCHTRRLRRLHLDQMDPSMLLAFLIRDEADWKAWRKEMSNVPGKPVLHIGAKEPVFPAGERDGAVDEVEILDDDDDEDNDDDEGDGEFLNIRTPL